MNEILISYNTAEVLKEKGFKDLCFCYYNNKKELQIPYLENGSSSDVDFRVDLEDLLEQHNNKCHNTFSAPSQSHLQKWLREVHNIFVTVDIDPDVYFSKVNYSANVKNCDKNKDSLGIRLLDGFTLYQTYEEALEEGLFEALKLIKK